MTDFTSTPVLRRGPGRPSNAERETAQVSEETSPRAPVPRQEETKIRRRRREGMGPERNLKLYVPEESKDPNFTYRWVNDRPGRVRQLTTMDDYEIVSHAELNGGDPDPAGNTAEGTVMSRTADSGIGEKTVLLKKLKEYYEADKKEEQKVIDAREEAMRRGPPAGSEGLSGPIAYVPGGKNIVAGR